MGKLDGKIAIITGGACGMGRATAEVFVREGAQVVIADLLDEEGTALANSLGSNASYIHLDVADERGWEQLVKATTEHEGRIDILVNNAGIFWGAAIENTPNEMFHRVLETNLIGPYLGMKTILPLMKKQRLGSIINISSTEGLRGTCEMGAYNAGKWGLRGLSKCVAMEAGPFGVRVNSIHPGTIDTPMLRQGPHWAEHVAADGIDPSREDMDDNIFPGITLGRMG